jgi:hypothetical protein
MSRLLRIVPFVCCLFILANRPAAGEPAALFGNHIRSSDPRLISLMALAADVSPTFRDIVSRIEASDVVAYVSSRPLMARNVSGQSSIISAAAGRRYVRVVVDSRVTGAPLVGLLGHELQHVSEIAREPSVVDNRSLRALYQRIGFGSWTSHDAFESADAVAAGRRVLRDALAHAAAVRVATVGASD